MSTKDSHIGIIQELMAKEAAVGECRQRLNEAKTREEEAFQKVNTALELMLSTHASVGNAECDWNAEKWFGGSKEAIEKTKRAYEGAKTLYEESEKQFADAKKKLTDAERFSKNAMSSLEAAINDLKNTQSKTIN